jgi:hypothetical protein
MARKDLVMATEILLASKAVTLPLRLITWISPGVMAVNSVAGVKGSGVGAVVFVAVVVVSVAISPPKN